MHREDRRTLRLEIPIRAVPGSNRKRSFVNPKTGRPVIVDKAKGKAQFTAAVRLFAAEAAREQGWELARDPVELQVQFRYARPACHYGTGRNAEKVKPSRGDARHAQSPDLTNLVKCIEDALTGIVWHDDRQVWRSTLSKVWGVTDSVAVDVVSGKSPNFAQEAPDDPSGPIYQATHQESVLRKARGVSGGDSPVVLPGQSSFLEESAQ